MNDNLIIPTVQKKAHQLEKHDDVRVDNYFWLRNRENGEVIEYLEAENAYKRGVEDATNGRERRNASDVFGPYNNEYLNGYQSVLNKRKENDE